MLKDLNERSSYWDTRYIEYKQGDSVKVPFEKHIEIFRDKKVLEIGAGEGRQMRAVIDIVKEYALADISARALNALVHKKIKNRHLINSYSDIFPEKYDIIHFWYVLHHVLYEELDGFVGFLCNHLNSEGLIIFNTPYLDYDSGNYKANGMKTTGFTLLQVRDALEERSDFRIEVADKSQWERSNGFLIIAQKEIVDG